MVIQHNLTSMFSQRQLGITSGIKSKSAEKLSSGYRINRAADDAAGLAISEKMRRQIRGLTQASENIQDGISLCQVADSNLNEIHDMLQRLNELAVKGANDTLTDEDRSYLDEEAQTIKKEIGRIFDTANFNEIKLFKPSDYVPEIIPDPAPTDTMLFYSSAGVIGGLEFNNIRYNITELQNAGLSIDSNGVSLKNQEVEFSLYNGERVCLKLNEGDTLDKVKRNYSWKADGNGIYINDKFAASWSEMGINGDGNDGGVHSLSFHGLKVELDIPQGDKLSTIISEINGGNASEPVSWDLSISSYQTSAIAPVKADGSTSVIQVTGSNKNMILDNFKLSATSSGLSIIDTTTGATVNGSFMSWSSVKNVGDALSKDTTGSGFPIVDWGLDVDSNDASQITFDSDALYHYKSNSADLPIEFYFTLSGVSSQEEILSVLNGKSFTGVIDCPASISIGSTSDGSSFSISNTNITANNEQAFAIQRSFGRSFSSNYQSDKMTGKLTWLKTKESESGRTTSISNRTESTQSSSRTNDGTLYMVKEKDDGNGNITYEYYSFNKYRNYSDKIVSYTQESSWTETDRITYSGYLQNSGVQESTDYVTMQLSQTDNVSFHEYTTYYNYSSLSSVDQNDIPSGANILTESEYYAIVTNPERDTSEGPKTYTNVVPTKLLYDGTLTHNGSFKNSSSPASVFDYSHRISYSTLASESSGSIDITVTPLSAATRTLTAAQNNATLQEPLFNNIELILPEKSLIIQAGSETEDADEIILKWSSLNLTKAGISGFDLKSQEEALIGISEVKNSLNIISNVRSIFGAYQNQMEHAVKNVDNVVENTQAAESLIRDTDMADEMQRYANLKILEQAGFSLVAQANQSRESVLSLLQ